VHKNDKEAHSHLSRVGVSGPSLSVSPSGQVLLPQLLSGPSGEQLLLLQLLPGQLAAVGCPPGQLLLQLEMTKRLVYEPHPMNRIRLEKELSLAANIWAT
jgi:hypothetical protein